MTGARAVALGFVIIAAALLGVFLIQQHDREPGKEADTAAGESEHAASSRGDESEKSNSRSIKSVTFAREERAPAVNGSDVVKAQYIAIGRVVDEERDPLSAAVVSIFRAGHTPFTTRTGADGTFRLSLGPQDAAYTDYFILYVQHEATHQAHMAYRGFGAWHEDDIFDLRTLILAPASDLPVRVLSEGIPIPDASVTLWYADSRLDRATTGVDGEVTLRCVPNGRYVLGCTAPGPRRCLQGVKLPRGGSDQVILELVPCHDVSVQVIEKTTGEPIPDAEVEVRQSAPGLWRTVDHEHPVETTDAIGRTVVRGVRKGAKIFVGARAPGYITQGTLSDSQESLKHEVDAGEIIVKLTRARRLAWPVVPGERPVPPDGSVIRFQGRRASSSRRYPSGRMEGDHLIVTGVTTLHFGAEAVAPDGSMARVRIGKDETVGRPISFRRPRTIEVHVRDADEAPVSGEGVVARDQGNGEIKAPVYTDKEGLARITGLYGGLATVFIEPGPKRGSGSKKVGTVNLEEGDGRLEATVGKKQEIVLVVTVDGKERLPKKTFYVRVIDAERGSLKEDPTSGEIRFWLRKHDPIKPASIRIQSEEYPTETARVPAGNDTGVVRVPIALTSAGKLIATVPRGPNSRIELELQEWWPEAGRWSWARSGPLGMRKPPVVSDRHVFPALKPARYRVREQRSGLHSEPVDIPAGPGTHEVTLDLSRMGQVKGKVIVPEGTNLSDVRVLLEGMTVSARENYGRFNPRSSGVRVRKDGTFRIVVPGASPVMLKPWHPLLVPAQEGGTLTLTEPGSDVVLRLVSASTARLRTEPKVKESRWIDYHPVRVLLYHGEPHGKPVSEHIGQLSADGIRFGGFQSGRWTIWIDIFGFAPLILREVELSDGENDLGTRTLSEGSTVRVTVKARPSSAPPRVSVWAHRIGLPQYNRGINSNGEAEASLSGLGPGKFKITIGEYIGTGGAQREHTVSVDGVSDARVTYDAR